ncbi:hypothetical protein CKO28_21995 [Rhodovibrio sodomensis]|uniref:Phytase-like domain-containing protein n=1 Tax=Rhodovibrio sodomensis TaxID=1088 RepID=A0ABS1DJM5_9PROT|nr:hypothetical protein [Rhodovibrio sodomensis]MBK1670696.1 hypothetical protein [Rhodovibrio sodomensis]
MAVLICLVALPASAREACWSGWGYFVAPGSLAFQSDRLLLVTDGPADWVPGKRIALYRLDPETGRRVDGRAPIVVRPRAPSFASRNGNRTVDDVAEVVGRDQQLMLGMTRIGPASAARSQDSLAWACGRAR